MSEWGGIAFVVLWVAVTCFVPGLSQSGTLCPDGWKFFQDYNGGGLCVLPVNEQKSWQEAADYCTNKYAYLLKLDMINQYTDNPGSDFQQRIGQLLFEDKYQDFWIGMHVQDGRLVWQAYGPEYVKRTKYEGRPWNWAQGHPSTDNGTCGLVNLGSRDEERPDPATDSSIIVKVFNDQYDVSLADCAGQRQFVCQRPAIPNFVETTSKCEEGWVGNPFLSDCYTVFNAPDAHLTYDEAVKACQAKSGELAPFASNVDRRIASRINEFFFDFGSPTEIEGTWVQTPADTKIDGQCQALPLQIVDAPEPDPIFVSCDTKLPYICRKPVIFKEPESVTVFTEYTDQTHLLNKEAFTPLPVSCQLSRAPTDSEILFIKTPGIVINSTDGWKYFQGFDLALSNDDDVPYYFNVTIPRIIAEARKRRNVQDMLQDGSRGARADERRILIRKKRQSLPLEDEIVRTTGYFSCGIHSLFPPFYTETEPVLVRYSESDLFIYIVQLTVQQSYISNDGETTPQDVTAFNLLQDFSYVDLLGEYLGSYLNNFNVETSWSTDIFAYRATLEKISGLVFHFRVIVGIRNSRSAELEQNVLLELSRYWSQRIRSRNDLFSGVEVLSTVTCPQQRIFEQGRRSVRFPATNIDAKAYSEDRCYLDTLPVGSSTCQGDYENGASWGPVTYTDNCLTEPGNICPQGWTRFLRTSDYRYTCILPVLENISSWPEAKRHCKKLEGHLLNQDGINNYYSYEIQSSLGQSLFDNGFSEYWSGINVEAGRLFWDGYNPEHVRRNKYESSDWQWAANQPSTNTGSCGKVTLGTREQTQTETTDNPVVVFSNQYLMALSNCNETRPFVCQRTPLSTQLAYSEKCEDGWVSNLFLPHCYRLFNGADDQDSYNAAKKKCIDMGAQMVSMEEQHNVEIAGAVLLFYNGNDFDYYSETDANKVWVYSFQNEAQQEGFCVAYQGFFGEGTSFDPVSEPCDTPLSFMCMKSAIPHEPASLTVDSPYQSQKKLLKLAAFSPQPLTMSLPRPPLASELLYIETPRGIINSTNDWKEKLGYELTTTFEDGRFSVNLVLPNPSEISSIEDLSNIVDEVPVNGFSDLPANGFSDLPTRLRRDLGFYDARGNHGRRRRGVAQIPTVPFIPSGKEIMETVGYYSFGLRTIYPPNYLESDPILVRYSESDLYIYVARLQIKENFTGISPEDFTSFSLLNDNSYLASLQEMTDMGFLDSVDIRADWLQLMHTYKAYIESYSNGTLQARVFVGITNSRLLSPEFEQTVMLALQKHWRSRIAGSDVFDKVQFKSTVACPLRKLARTKDDQNQEATFGVTRIGEIAHSWERCYKMSGALATAKCEGGFQRGARWGTMTFRDNCEKTPALNQSESTTDLKILSELEITKDNFFEIVQNTSYLTQPIINLTEADIIYVADILYNYQQFGIIEETTFDFVLDTINNILDTAYGLIGKAQTLDNAANRIIKALDDISHLLQLGRAGRKRFIKRFLVAEVLQQQPTDLDLTLGISLSNNGSDMVDKGSNINSIKEGAGVSSTEVDVAIYLPADLFKSDVSRLTFHLFGKTDLFSPVGGKYKTNSKVAAARLTVGDQAVTELGSSPVTAIFLPFEEDENLVCGFWNYSVNEDGGGWSTDGCILSKENGRVICKCNHLTNFAVLIDLEGHAIPDIHKKILSIITIIGLSLSIIGLGLTILGFIMFKHLRNGRGQQVLVMLSLSMLCSSIIFLIGMDKTDNRGGCIAVAVLLHYFILVSFMWMLVEGVLQYLRFVKVLGTYIPNFLIKSTIPAWGIPLIPVIVVLAIDYNMYYGGKGYCWLSFKPMLYAFIIPVAVIIFANIIVFTLVLCNLCRRRNKGMMVNQSERKMAFLHFQAALSIFVILGLTWVFGFLAIDDARIVFHYVFAILNAFQGFFIFLLFTAREKLIRQAWAKFCCGRRYKEKSSAHSASDTRTGRKGSHDTSGMTGSTGSGAKFSNIAYENGNRH